MEVIHSRFELPTDKEGIIIPENSPLNYEIEADIYKGYKNQAVVIIVGKGGSVKGYEDKYVKIALNLVGEYQINVFVIENPGISWDNPELYFDCTMNFVENKMKEFGYNKFSMNVMGFSAGGHFVGRFAYKYPDIEKILLVNPVLRVDFEKLKKSLLEFKGEIIIVQGDKDTDFQFNSLLNQITNAKIEVLDGVDHQFTNEGGLETFKELAKRYFFGYVTKNCPFCGEKCDGDDYECKRCGSRLYKNFRPNEVHFPREDIENCIKKDDERGIMKCPICGENMLNIYFKSPARTWQHLCGRAGNMNVCTNCKKGFNFRCHIMN